MISKLRNILRRQKFNRQSSATLTTLEIENVLSEVEKLEEKIKTLELQLSKCESRSSSSHEIFTVEISGGKF